MGHLDSSSGSLIGSAELAEYDGFHRGAGAGRGRCWGKEEVKGNCGSCCAVHRIKVECEIRKVKKGEQAIMR